jgi:HK97 family phage major capsid protein
MNDLDIAPLLERFAKAASGKIDATDQKVADMLIKQAELQARLQEAEQKLDKRTYSGLVRSEDESIASLVQADDGFKMVASGRIKSTSLVIPSSALHSKAAMTSANSSPLLAPDRQTGIVFPALRRLTVRDLLTAIRTDAGSIEYVRETSNTNAAAIVAEGAVKPESTVAFEKITCNVITIAHWIQCSVQVLADARQLQSYLENRLFYNLRYAEEVRLLKGSGTGSNLLGLYVAATPYVAPITIASPTKIDVVRLAIDQLENSNYAASGVLMSPDDWCAVELLKNTNGDYLKSDPATTNVRSLWGRPVVTSAAMSPGTFLVGDFAAAATLFDRQDPVIDLATMDQDDFIRNLAKIRCEERISLAVQLPGALVKGAF